MRVVWRMPFFNPQAYATSKSSHLGPAALLRHRGDVWDLVLSLSETSALLELSDEEAWSSHAAKLEAVVASGSLGRRLFGFAVAQTLGEAMAACIAGHLNQMPGQETITQAVLIESKKAATKDVLAMRSLELLPEKRAITRRHRGMPMLMKITRVQGEISLTFACAIKGQAVDASELEPMFAEEPC